jgi:hypothetical protein
MPVPWLQIVSLMPSILELSRDLLKRSRGQPVGESAGAAPATGTTGAALHARITALEENERRQAELVTSMADQLAQLTAAATALHAQNRRLWVGQIVAAVVAVVALVFALR